MYAGIVYYLNLIYWQQVICFKSVNLEQVTSKYSEWLYLCWTIITVPNNYHCNLNSKFNRLFHSLNVTECTLGVNIPVLHYICCKLTSLENHCLKAEVLLTFHSNSTVLEESTMGYIWEDQKAWITSS